MPDIFISHEKESNAPKAKTTLSEDIIRDVKEKRKEGKAHIAKDPVRAFSAFAFYPDGIDFETREEKEEVVLFLRQHLIVNIPWILTTLIMIFAPLLLQVFPLLSFLPGNFQFVLVMVWYLLTMAYALEKLLSWFFNIYIVTDERVIDVDFYNLIYKEVSDANIDKIQDVTYTMGGVLQTLFNYGGVLIETAGEIPNIEFLSVPDPARVARILQDLKMQEQQEAIEGRVR